MGEEQVGLGQGLAACYLQLKLVLRYPGAYFPFHILCLWDEGG